MSENNQKNRKSEAQERFDEADNAGRFAGNDADARAARKQAKENIRQDTGSSRDERADERDATGAGERNGPEYAQDFVGDAQNVNDDNGRPMTDEEAEHARNKATEGLRQGRNRS